MAIGMHIAKGTAHSSERPNLFWMPTTTGEDGEPNRATE